MRSRLACGWHTCARACTCVCSSRSKQFATYMYIFVFLTPGPSLYTATHTRKDCLKRLAETALSST